jgi:hypothetical protein
MKRKGFMRKTFERAAPSAPKRLERAVVLADCSSMQQPVAKDPPHKNAHLLSMAKGMPCLIRSPICNFDTETTVACHAGGVSNGKGMGYKVSDAQTVWGCSACNHYTDAYGRATKAEKVAAFELALVAQAEQYEAIVENVRAKPKDRAAAQWWLRNQPTTTEEAA